MKKETKKKIEKEAEPQEQKPKETEKPEFDFMGMLNNPAVTKLLESGKDLFKKEKADPNVCEITIKAPSEVVLKLFKVSEDK